jgi:polyisoprenyl-phosphate glycosyltransferase
MTPGEPLQAPIALSIVVPCFNEEAVLLHMQARLCLLREQLLDAGKISTASEIILVDDGSCDRTWDMISQWVLEGAPIVGVKLSRNCGHQNALLAGLSKARGEAVITIDADLQDDENAIGRMIDAFRQGHEVVYGVRSGRACDSWFKRASARAFYRMMAALGVRTVFDHADYRLLSRRAVQYLGQFHEVNLFLRGIVPLLGLRSCIVRYDRKPRMAGQSKYPLAKMIEFALDGITSFSVKPLRMITVLGFSVSLGCVVLAVWALLAKLLTTDAVPGWASTILPIYFLGGVQLFCAGVLGEYVGKIYVEVKNRPRFLVEKVERQRRAPLFESRLVSRAHRRTAARASPAARTAELAQ